MHECFTIKEAAKRTGLTPKTIRYYEQMGLIPAVERSRPGFKANGYRLFTQRDINRLEFVKRAKHLSLSLAQVKELLTATERGSGRPQLLALVEQKLSEIDDTVQDLRALRRALKEFRQRAENASEITRSCCEPVCGPLTCEPESRTAALVQVGKSARFGKEVAHV